MATPYPHLFSPIRIRNVEVRNRIVSTAHSPCYAEGGLPSDRLIRYYADRAKGGIGLIVLEAIRVHPTTLPSPEQGIAGWDPRIVPPLKRAAEVVKGNGATLFGQIVHQGGQVGTQAMRPMLPLWAPSPVACARYHEVPHEMTHAEIREVIEAHVRSAGFLKEAGFDGVEIHAAHGYIPQQFLSPYTNHRTDEYGGSLQNRMRFVVELIDAVRSEVGQDMVVGIRISADEFTDGGLDLAAMQEITPLIVDTGQIDYVSVTHCNYQTGSSYATMIPDMHFPLAAFEYLAAGIREVVDTVPVIAVGRITHPDVAERILVEGHADLVGMTRANIADPELANKAKEGRADDIRLCIGCNQGCAGMVHAGRPMTCLVNPTVGLEAEWGLGSLRPVDHPKKVVVVGGGPAGMEAARVAASRGHRVVLFERDSQLGGQINLAVIPPGRADFGELPGYLGRQMEQLGVDVRKGVEVGLDAVLAEKPDAVVVATGSRPMLPEVPGARAGQLPRLGTAVDALKGQLELGRRVVLVDDDGHHKAAATSEWLADQGVEVIHITARAGLATDAPGPNINGINQRLRGKGVQIRISTDLRRVEAGHVVLYDVFSDQEEDISDVDAVVFAGHNRAEDGLYRALLEGGAVPEVYVAGDASAPRRALEAMHEGHRVARLI